MRVQQLKQRFLYLILILSITFSFTSCGDDDGDGTINPLSAFFNEGQKVALIASPSSNIFL